MLICELPSLFLSLAFVVHYCYQIMYLFIAEVVDDAQQICSLINYVGFLGNDVTAKFVIK